MRAERKRRINETSPPDMEMAVGFGFTGTGFDADDHVPLRECGPPKTQTGACDGSSKVDSITFPQKINHPYLSSVWFSRDKDGLFLNPYN